MQVTLNKEFREQIRLACEELPLRQRVVFLLPLPVGVRHGSTSTRCIRLTYLGVFLCRVSLMVSACAAEEQRIEVIIKQLGAGEIRARLVAA